MAITIDAARTTLPPPQTLDLDSVRGRSAARDLPGTTGTTVPDGTRDTTTAAPPAEVRALQEQLVGSRGDDAAVHARRDLGSREGGGVQIGVRARVATEGIQNVGHAGSTSTGR